MMSRKLLLSNIILVMGLMVACEGPVLPAGDNNTSHDPYDPNMLQCPKTTIEGKDGDTVILSCSTKNKMDLSLEQVEWLFEDPTTGKNESVHRYFQHQDYLHDQRDDFRHRTSLFKEELSSGNCSLRLKVNTAHSGRYFCSVPGHQSCTVTLKVLPAGKNNPPQTFQDDTTSPDNPKNGTDGQTNFLALNLLALLLFLASSLWSTFTVSALSNSTQEEIPTTLNQTRLSNHHKIKKQRTKT